MNQITKNYIKRKLEKKVGQCGGIQGRQDHIVEEEKKNTTPCCFVSLSAHELSLCVSMETEMRKNGKWGFGKE